MEVNIMGLGESLPEYETTGSSGMDLKAYLPLPASEIVLKPGERALIPTGYRIEVPEGFEAEIRGRSGLALKHGIGLANGIGTIDSDYRGEIKVILINWGNENFVVRNGDKIAQMVIAPYVKVSWNKVDSISDTKRGSGGFGHTGK